MIDMIILAILIFVSLLIGMWLEREASLAERHRRRRAFWAKSRNQNLARLQREHCEERS